MKVLAITQARTGSSRLPGKVLKTVNGKTLLQLHLERASKSRLIDTLVVATTIEPTDTAIFELAKDLSFPTFRGSESDVLDRYYQAARQYSPDYVVRITSDCPLIDADLIDSVIAKTIDSGSDYGSNCIVRTYPIGTDVEVFRFIVLEDAWRMSRLQSQREHVTPYIVTNSDCCGGKLFKATSVTSEVDYSNFRLTVDYAEDFDLVSVLVDQLGASCGWFSYIDYLMKNPDTFAINRHRTPVNKSSSL